MVELRQNTVPFRTRAVPVQHSVLVVRDDTTNNDYLEAVCEFLDIGVEHASSGGDLDSAAAWLASDGAHRRFGR